MFDFILDAIGDFLSLIIGDVQRKSKIIIAISVIIIILEILLLLYILLVY